MAGIMLDLDFLEIGTCDFRTLIQKADSTTIGISVEPLKIYLDRLPNPENVKKVNCAISFDDTEGDIDFYYIDPAIIKKNKLPKWVKGCNSINDYHLKIKENNLQNLCEIIKVRQYPISTFLEMHKVRKIHFLKLDTEGGDSYILLNLLKYLKNKPTEYYPNVIKFESNRLTPPDMIEKVINEFTAVGYKLDFRNDLDTQLSRI